MDIYKICSKVSMLLVATTTTYHRGRNSESHMRAPILQEYLDKLACARTSTYLPGVSENVMNTSCVPTFSISPLTILVRNEPIADEAFGFER